MEEESIFSFSLPWLRDELKPSLQAFNAPARVIEITLPDTLDTVFDPVWEIGIGLDELCACVAGGEEALPPLEVDFSSYWATPGHREDIHHWACHCITAHWGGSHATVKHWIQKDIIYFKNAQFWIPPDLRWANILQILLVDWWSQ